MPPAAPIIGTNNTTANTTRLFEAWIVADNRGNVQVMIVGSDGFERRVLFPLDEESAKITDSVRHTLDD